MEKIDNLIKDIEKTLAEVTKNKDKNLKEEYERLDKLPSLKTQDFKAAVIKELKNRAERSYDDQLLMMTMLKKIHTEDQTIVEGMVNAFQERDDVLAQFADKVWEQINTISHALYVEMLTTYYLQHRKRPSKEQAKGIAEMLNVDWDSFEDCVEEGKRSAA